MDMDDIQDSSNHEVDFTNLTHEKQTAEQEETPNIADLVAEKEKVSEIRETIDQEMMVRVLPSSGLHIHPFTTYQ